jgi:D-glycero-D-manno-heptose 1,7-bisphosphate phosphatase
MKQAVILDRDGVINDHQRYVNHPQDLILYPTTAPAIRVLNEAGFFVCVATNQGGVGLGYLRESMLERIHAEMCKRLDHDGAHIDDIRACIHAPNDGCDCRKPKPGLLLALQEDLGFDLTHSYMVGDRDTDVIAGQAAGTRTVLIGKRTSVEVTTIQPDFIAPNLLVAAQWIVSDATSSVSS